MTKNCNKCYLCSSCSISVKFDENVSFMSTNTLEGKGEPALLHVFSLVSYSFYTELIFVLKINTYTMT